MSNFVLNQTVTFFIFIICGVLVGLLFDFFRILRKTFKTPDFVTYIEDIVFWLLTCILLAYTIFKFNDGELRAFIFIGLFIGILFYILLISKYVIKICTKISIFIKNLIYKVGKIIILPIVKFLKLMKNFVNFEKIKFKKQR